jgi:type II secretory pathway pseudopilin PulG
VIYTIVVILLAVVIGVGLLLFFRSLAEERARAAEERTRRLELLLDEVKELAWQNRDIAPELSTIIIDTIRTTERNDRRRELP